MWSYPEVLEIEKLYTNDTHQVAKTYGIEAAGRVIAAVSVLDGGGGEGGLLIPSTLIL